MGVPDRMRLVSEDPFPMGDAVTGSSVGAVLRTHRIAAGLTQTQLAALSGVPQARVSDYERDVLSARTEDRERLEAALGLARGQTLCEAGLVDLDAMGLGDAREQVGEAQRHLAAAADALTLRPQRARRIAS